MRTFRLKNSRSLNADHSAAKVPGTAMYPQGNELAIVILCARPQPKEKFAAQEEQIERLCAQGVNWETFLRLIERHQTTGLATDALRPLSRAIPRDVSELLEERQLASWQTAIAHTRELVSILETFRESNVDLIPLKGTILSSKLFGDPAKRSVRDLDLLVKPENLAAAHDILINAGYMRTSPTAELTPKQTRAFVAHCHHAVYFNETKNILLELHWRLSRWSDREMETLWEKAEPIEWMGASTLQVDDATLLVLLCDHGCKHRFSRLKWLSDIVMLLMVVTDWDWALVVSTAGELNLELPLAQSLLLASWLFEIEIDPELLRWIDARPHARLLATECLRSIVDWDDSPYSPKHRQTGAKHLVSRFRESCRTHWYLARMRKAGSLTSWLDRFLVALPDFEQFPIPDKFFWLYVPLRPYFWIYRHARRNRPGIGPRAFK